MAEYGSTDVGLVACGGVAMCVGGCSLWKGVKVVAGFTWGSVDGG